MKTTSLLAQILREEALWAGDFLIMPPRKAPDRTPTGLEAIREKLGDCTRCGLAATRTHIVFGEGNPEARVMFIGEAPGAVEDETCRRPPGLRR